MRSRRSNIQPRGRDWSLARTRLRTPPRSPAATPTSCNWWARWLGSAVAGIKKAAFPSRQLPPSPRTQYQSWARRCTSLRRWPCRRRSGSSWKRWPQSKSMASPPSQTSRATWTARCAPCRPPASGLSTPTSSNPPHTASCAMSFPIWANTSPPRIAAGASIKDRRRRE